MSPSIFDVIHHTGRQVKTIGWLTGKLRCSETELRSAVAAAAKQGFLTQITDGYVFTRLAIKTGTSVTLGSAKPGRYNIAHYTDPHWGSKHSLRKAQVDFLKFAWKEGCRVAAITGDLTDGVKPLLVPEQRFTGADEQLAEGQQIWRDVYKAGCKYECAATTGNHDGYTSHAIGSDFGRVIEERMRADGINWTNTGTCLGHAVLHGARTELWHPHGAASTTNAIRRTLNARAENLEEPVDLLLSGHYHHVGFTYAMKEDVFCAAGATFQTKQSEFANRISAGWNVGGSIISFTIGRNGLASEFSGRFFPSVQT